MPADSGDAVPIVNGAGLIWIAKLRFDEAEAASVTVALKGRGDGRVRDAQIAGAPRVAEWVSARRQCYVDMTAIPFGLCAAQDLPC